MMTESELQAATIDLAHLYRWKCAFFRPARTSEGWRTPVGADGKGWPDCVFVRERVLAVEFKSDVGKLAPAQQEWLDAFRDAGAEAHTWRPSHWVDGAILATLRSNQSTTDHGDKP